MAAAWPRDRLQLLQVCLQGPRVAHSRPCPLPVRRAAAVSFDCRALEPRPASAQSARASPEHFNVMST
jgi:hypothetical protein